MSEHLMGIAVPDPGSEGCLSIENTLMMSLGISLKGHRTDRGLSNSVFHLFI